MIGEPQCDYAIVDRLTCFGPSAAEEDIKLVVLEHSFTYLLVICSLSKCFSASFLPHTVSPTGYTAVDRTTP